MPTSIPYTIMDGCACITKSGRRPPATRSPSISVLQPACPGRGAAASGRNPHQPRYGQSAIIIPLVRLMQPSVAYNASSDRRDPLAGHTPPSGLWSLPPSPGLGSSTAYSYYTGDQRPHSTTGKAPCMSARNPTVSVLPAAGTVLIPGTVYKKTPGVFRSHIYNQIMTSKLCNRNPCSVN